MPVIERFQDVRVAVALIGAGLPTASTSELPSEVKSQIPAGWGSVNVPGVPDQSTCLGFTDDPLSTGQLCPNAVAPCDSPYQPRYNTEAPFATNFAWGPRCHYHEEWAGADMWIVQDELIDLPAAGEYYIVFWAPGDQLLGEPTHTAK